MKTITANKRIYGINRREVVSHYRPKDYDAKRKSSPFEEDVYELGVTTKQAVSCLQNSDDFTVKDTPFGLNIHNKKSKKTLSVNLAPDNKGTYSIDKGKYYYQKAGKNQEGGSWNVMKVPKMNVRMYIGIKDFLKWYFS